MIVVIVMVVVIMVLMLIVVAMVAVAMVAVAVVTVAVALSERVGKNMEEDVPEQPAAREAEQHRLRETFSQRQHQQRSD